MTAQLSNILVQDAYLAFNKKIVFENLNFTIPGKKWTCILGPSGVGKSTLLQLIAGIIAYHPTSTHNYQATIRLANGEPLAGQIAYMAQTDSLLPWLTVLENVLLCLRLRPYPKDYQIQLKEKATNLLEHVGLSHALNSYPKELSGGMRQRVSLVRTLIEEKPIILMDEPFSAVDAITRHKLQSLAASLLTDKTVLLVTHDPAEALRLGDNIYLLSGHPATISQPITLSTPPPRSLDTNDFSLLHAEIYDQLAKAHQG